MKIAMMFPGYGSQFVGMGKELYDEYRIVQEDFEQAASCLDINFVKLCFASSESELRQMRNAYAATFLMSSSIVSVLKDKGVVPEVVAGFNTGEYAALYAAGGWSLPDGLYLLNKFAGFYEQMLAGMQAQAIQIKGLSAEQVEDACFKANSIGDPKAYVALYETAAQHIVAGETAAVEQVRTILSDFADAQEIDISQVDLAVGLHSPLMDPVIAQFKMYLEKVDFHDLSACMLESLNGECIERGARTKERVIKRIHSPVIWTRVMEGLAPYDIVVQMGPGTQLAQWVQKMYPEKKVMAINKPEDIEALVKLNGNTQENSNKTE